MLDLSAAEDVLDCGFGLEIVDEFAEDFSFWGVGGVDVVGGAFEGLDYEFGTGSGHGGGVFVEFEGDERRDVWIIQAAGLSGFNRCWRTEESLDSIEVSADV